MSRALPAPVHLPGLNGIRTIAALTVLLYHIDQFSRLFGLPSLGFSESGGALNGVMLFFVLSGYLITYLLLVEKRTCGRVRVRDFYVRRILRIWPLYYLSFFGTAIVLAFMTVEVPGGLPATLLLYGLLLSNVGYALGYGVLTLFPLWSVGVEEQFYALWPLLMNNAHSATRALLGVLCGYLAIKLCLRLAGGGVIYNLVEISPYSCMAIGGLMAVAVLDRSPLLTIVFSPPAQVIAWLVLGLSLGCGPFHVASVVDREINAVDDAVVIANVSMNPKTLISMEHRLFDVLGGMSYGIYMLHLPWLVVVAYVVHDRAGVVLPPTVASYGVVYAMVIGGTLLLAAASYRWFERPFLRRKSAFSPIKTRPAIVSSGLA